MKLKRRRKVSRMHGRHMGTHGWGARKKHVSTGHQGGRGMGGSGKKGGSKKTLIHKLYGHDYFGKQGITSRGSRRKKNTVINLGILEKNLNSLKAQFLKKEGKEEILDLGDYKILGEGEMKTKLTIKANSASKSAIEKIEKVGGKIILVNNEDEQTEEVKK
jgi:large subunit ribosomal protein L15